MKKKKTVSEAAWHFAAEQLARFEQRRQEFAERLRSTSPLAGHARMASVCDDDLFAVQFEGRFNQIDHFCLSVSDRLAEPVLYLSGIPSDRLFALECDVRQGIEIPAETRVEDANFYISFVPRSPAFHHRLDTGLGFLKRGLVDTDIFCLRIAKNRSEYTLTIGSFTTEMLWRLHTAILAGLGEKAVEDRYRSFKPRERTESSWQQTPSADEF